MRGLWLALWVLGWASWGAVDTARYQPVFMQPHALRALQSAHEPGIPRLGPFGLPQPAAARFGWERVQQDSGHAYDAARTLWLDYYCLFGDSSCADWALIRSPRAVRRRETPTYRWNELPVPRPDTAVWARPIAFRSQGADLFRAERTDPGLATSAAGLEAAAPPLPAAAPGVPAQPPKSAQPELRIVVRQGDNFGVIQRRYPGVTLKQLYAANKGSDRIYPGQVLKIPR